MSTNGKVHVKKVSRGYRPQFFDDPINDKLLSMILSMATEMWVMRERLDTIEAIADSKGLILKNEIESYDPPPERDEAREAMRQEFLDRIFYLMQEEAADAVRQASKEAYDRVIADSAAEE